jgi:hypothetical protein
VSMCRDGNEKARRLNRAGLPRNTSEFNPGAGSPSRERE